MVHSVIAFLFFTILILSMLRTPILCGLFRRNTLGNNKYCTLTLTIIMILLSLTMSVVLLVYIISGIVLDAKYPPEVTYYENIEYVKSVYLVDIKNLNKTRCVLEFILLVLGILQTMMSLLSFSCYDPTHKKKNHVDEETEILKEEVDKAESI
mmetsp:Transcript_485/g.874  ORF Transcript_485/g.874 Transcript_485/m.874 type:complete len:153 (-) Transcript_485:62-520(-)